MRNLLTMLCICFFSLLANAQRLPANVVPLHYQLRLDPDLATGILTGDETIRVHIVSPTDKIVLNSVDLALSHPVVTADKAMDAAVSYDSKREMVTLQLPRAVNAGDATIHFE